MHLACLGTYENSDVQTIPLKKQQLQETDISSFICFLQLLFFQSPFPQKVLQFGHTILYKFRYVQNRDVHNPMEQLKYNNPKPRSFPKKRFTQLNKKHSFSGKDRRIECNLNSTCTDLRERETMMHTKNKQCTINSVQTKKVMKNEFDKRAQSQSNISVAFSKLQNVTFPSLYNSADSVNQKRNINELRKTVFMSNTSINKKGSKIYPLESYLYYLKHIANNKALLLLHDEHYINMNARYNLRIKFMGFHFKNSKNNIQSLCSNAYNTQGRNTRRNTTRKKTIRAVATSNPFSKKYSANIDIKDAEKECNISLTTFQEICFSLINVFHNRMHAYQKQICEQHIILIDTPSYSDIFDYIMQEIEPYTFKMGTGQCRQKVIINFDDTVKDLLAIFPDADTLYLKDTISKMSQNLEGIEDFILEQCENPTYVKRDEKLKTIRIREQQEQYTVAFNVANFLEIFPDPFKHFQNPNRKCKFDINALVFLEHYFKLHKNLSIAKVFEKCCYNLTLTVYELEWALPDNVDDSSRSISSWQENLPDDIDITVLQECAFIQHKNEIKQYLDELQKQKLKKFQQLKKRNGLVVCLCCYSDECMPSECSTCNIGHVFCNECIKTTTTLMLAQGKTQILCLANCDSEFSLSTLEKALPQTQFNIFICKRQEAEVMAANLDGLVSCPFCHFACILPPGDKIFKCLNPECLKQSCRLCKKLNHIPEKCNRKAEQARLVLQEKMTESVVRKCRKCCKSYVKQDGCNYITCTCNAVMCYVCEEAVTDSHFLRGGCPSKMNDVLVDSIVVDATARRTLDMIQSNDPEIEVDTTGLLTPLRVAHNYSILPEHTSAAMIRLNKITRPNATNKSTTNFRG